MWIVISMYFSGNIASNRKDFTTLFQLHFLLQGLSCGLHAICIRSRVIYKEALTRKQLEKSQFQSVCLCSLLSNTLFIRKQNGLKLQSFLYMIFSKDYFLTGNQQIKLHPTSWHNPFWNKLPWSEVASLISSISSMVSESNSWDPGWNFELPTRRHLSNVTVKLLLDSNVIGVLRVPSKSPSSLSFTMSREPSGIKDKNSLVSLLILTRANQRITYLLMLVTFWN